MRDQCECGCGHPTAATMRMRPLRCGLCGCPARMSRVWLERNGAPTCGCGGTLWPVCLVDRAALPGDDGREAWAEFQGRRARHDILSERSTNAAATRSRRAAARRGELRSAGVTQRDIVSSVPRAVLDEIPF